MVKLAVHSYKGFQVRARDAVTECLALRLATIPCSVLEH
jgi:hypothetical protein